MRACLPCAIDTMTNETICLHLHISGHVQGVGFRASLEDKARSLQLSGWVRNCRDGRVEAMVQGPGPAIHTLVQWCHRGPATARVDSVHALQQPVDPTLRALHCVASA